MVANKRNLLREMGLQIWKIEEEITGSKDENVRKIPGGGIS